MCLRGNRILQDGNGDLLCVFIIYKWVSPEMGVPPNHPFFKKGCSEFFNHHYQPSSYWGSSTLGNHQNLEQKCRRPPKLRFRWGKGRGAIGFCGSQGPNIIESHKSHKSHKTRGRYAIVVPSPWTRRRYGPGFALKSLQVTPPFSEGLWRLWGLDL